MLGLFSVACESGVEWLGDGTGNDDKHHNKPEDDKNSGSNNQTQNIFFQDNNTKRLCVEAWDRNGDGELSYEEAAAVTDLGTTFEGSVISAFNELQHFTGLNVVAAKAFSECMSLKEITLPAQVVAIEEYAFRRCIVLKRIIIPESVTEIGTCAFYDCLELANIVLHRNIADIGDSAFRSCTGTLTISSKFIESHEYNQTDENWLTDAGFTTINIGDGVTVIGTTAFRGCTSLINVMIPASVTSIKDAAFYGCTSLEGVYCQAELPPALSPYAFHNNSENRKFYVPEDSVEIYQSAELWTTYADVIVAYF